MAENNEKNKLDINKLLLQPLETSFIRKNFIVNFDVNYEEYLTELINCSKFVTDYGNYKFNQIEEQSHNECDITNGIYSLDYKLLIDDKTMENLFFHSTNISIDENNVRSFYRSKKTGKWRRYILLTIFRNVTKQEIEKIDNSSLQDLDEFQKLIKKYIKNIKMDKNILYFIPYNFYFKNTTMSESILNYIGNELSIHLKGFFDYRKTYTNNKDTYMCFVSKENMVFFKYEEKLNLYDIVALEKSKLYCEVEDICDTWGDCFD